LWCPASSVFTLRHCLRPSRRDGRDTDPRPPFTADDANAGRVERKKETDPHRLAQRRRQLELGYNTPAYAAYSKAVPKSRRVRRDPRHPMTPDPEDGSQSKRQFDGRVKEWRRRLHLWDEVAERAAMAELAGGALRLAPGDTKSVAAAVDAAAGAAARGASLEEVVAREKAARAGADAEERVAEAVPVGAPGVEPVRLPLPPRPATRPRSSDRDGRGRGSNRDDRRRDERDRSRGRPRDRDRKGDARLIATWTLDDPRLNAERSARGGASFEDFDDEEPGWSGRDRGRTRSPRRGAGDRHNRAAGPGRGRGASPPPAPSEPRARLAVEAVRGPCGRERIRYSPEFAGAGEDGRDDWRERGDARTRLGPSRGAGRRAELRGGRGGGGGGGGDVGGANGDDDWDADIAV